MDLMLPARPVDVPAAGACLARVGRVHHKEGAAVPDGLVQELLLKVIVGPAHLCVAVLCPHAFRGSPDPGQILEDEERAFRMSADECLGDTMVHIVHPTVFSLPDGADPASRGGRLPFLKLTAEFFVMGPFLFDRCAGIEGSLLTVAGNSEEADAPVDTDDLLARRGSRRVRDMDRHGDVQEELSMSEYQFRCSVYCPFSKSPIHGVCTEPALDPSPERIDAEEPFGLIRIPDKGVIPVPDKTELWGTEGRSDVNMTFLFTESARMLSLICPDRFVRGDYSTGNADSHLRAQPESLTACMVRSFLYVKDIQRDMVRMYKIRDVCAGSRISLRRIDQELSIRRLWNNLQFCGQCLLHEIRPFSNSIIAHLFE